MQADTVENPGSIYAWQSDAWRLLCERRVRLPHALLLHGRSGLGKSRLALVFAKAILCPNSRDSMPPCGQCAACGWFDQGNHPDFRLIQPESMLAESNPAADRKLSKQIKTEQVRDLETLLSVGSHRGGSRVIMLAPADAMNGITQNALLKRLEEPAPGTLFLLVTSHPDNLLATVRSRCQAFPVFSPPIPLAEDWLRSGQHPSAVDHLKAAGGAPLAALAMVEAEQARAQFASRLSEGNFDPLELAAACGNIDPETVINWIQCWIHDLAMVKISAAPRFFPNYASQLQKLGARSNLEKIVALNRTFSVTRGLASHPLIPRLYFEGLLMEYLQSLRQQ